MFFFLGGGALSKGFSEKSKFCWFIELQNFTFKNQCKAKALLNLWKAMSYNKKKKKSLYSYEYNKIE